MKEKKWFYCPICKLFPDEIEEVLERVTETRRWDGECYELVETKRYQDSLYFCSHCRTELEDLSPLSTCFALK